MGGLLGAGFFCQGRSVGRVEVKYLWVGILPSSLFASLGLFILGWLSTRETIIPLSKCKVMEEEQAWSGALPLLKVILLGKGRKRKMSSPNVDSLKKKCWLLQQLLFLRVTRIGWYHGVSWSVSRVTVGCSECHGWRPRPQDAPLRPR